MKAGERWTRAAGLRFRNRWTAADAESFGGRAEGAESITSLGENSCSSACMNAASLFVGSIVF